MFAAQYESVHVGVLPPRETQDFEIIAEAGASISVHRGVLRVRARNPPVEILEGFRKEVGPYSQECLNEFWEAVYKNKIIFRHSASVRKLWADFGFWTIESYTLEFNGRPRVCPQFAAEVDAAIRRQIQQGANRGDPIPEADTKDPFIPPFLEWRAAKPYLLCYFRDEHPSPTGEDDPLKAEAPAWNWRTTRYDEVEDAVADWARQMNWTEAMAKSFRYESVLPCMKWKGLDPRRQISVTVPVRGDCRGIELFTMSQGTIIELWEDRTGAAVTIEHKDLPSAPRTRLLTITGFVWPVKAALQELSHRASQETGNPYRNFEPEASMELPYEFLERTIYWEYTPLLPATCRNPGCNEATVWGHQEKDCPSNWRGRRRSEEQQSRIGRAGAHLSTMRKVGDWLRERARIAEEDCLPYELLPGDPITELLKFNLQNEQKVTDFPEVMREFLARGGYHCYSEWLSDNHPDRRTEVSKLNFLRRNEGRAGHTGSKTFIMCACADRPVCRCRECVGPRGHVRQAECVIGQAALVQQPAERQEGVDENAAVVAEEVEGAAAPPDQGQVPSVGGYYPWVTFREGAARGRARSRPVNVPVDLSDPQAASVIEEVEEEAGHAPEGEVRPIVGPLARAPVRPKRGRARSRSSFVAVDLHDPQPGPAPGREIAPLPEPSAAQLLPDEPVRLAGGRGWYRSKETEEDKSQE